jgi:plasmid maintenance system antidote protein VapI
MEETIVTRKAAARAANTARRGEKQKPQSSVMRSTTAPVHRSGRVATGLYPQISRTLLAEHGGLHITTITSMLNGRTLMKAEMAGVLTKALGISIEELIRDLAVQRAIYAKDKSVKQARRPSRPRSRG